jgi:hypothetical protein
MDMESKSCKHLENQIVAWELTHGFLDNTFMKNSNGTLGVGDFYPGHMAVIKGSVFVNSTVVGISPRLNLNSVRSPRLFIEI